MRTLTGCSLIDSHVRWRRMYAPEGVPFGAFLQRSNVVNFIATELFEEGAFNPPNAANLFHHIQRQEALSVESVQPFVALDDPHTCYVNLLIDELLSGATEGRIAAVRSEDDDAAFRRLRQCISDLRAVMERCPYLNVVVTSLGGLPVQVACSLSKTVPVFLTGAPLADTDDCVRVFMAHMQEGCRAIRRTDKRVEVVSHLIQLCAGHPYTVAEAGEMFAQNPDATACDVLGRITPKPWSPSAMSVELIVRGLLGLSIPETGLTLPVYKGQTLTLDWFVQHGESCDAVRHSENCAYHGLDRLVPGRIRYHLPACAAPHSHCFLQG